MRQPDLRTGSGSRLGLGRPSADALARGHAKDGRIAPLRASCFTTKARPGRRAVVGCQYLETAATPQDRRRRHTIDGSPSLPRFHATRHFKALVDQPGLLPRLLLERTGLVPYREVDQSIDLIAGCAQIVESPALRSTRDAGLAVGLDESRPVTRVRRPPSSAGRNHDPASVSLRRLGHADRGIAGSTLVAPFRRKR